MEIRKAPLPLVKNSASQGLTPLAEKLRQGAQMYEKHFLREMVKAMRKSVHHSSFTRPSMAEGIYQEQLDSQYVDQWVKAGGTGLSEVIYKDLVRKFYPQLEGAPPPAPRPIVDPDLDGIEVQSPPQGDPHKQSFYLKLKGGPGLEGRVLKMPWEGTFVGQGEWEGGKKWALFSHPQGLQSTFAFQGQIPSEGARGEWKAGETWAHLSPQEQILTWQLSLRKG